MKYIVCTGFRRQVEVVSIFVYNFDCPVDQSDAVVIGSTGFFEVSRVSNIPISGILSVRLTVEHFTYTIQRRSPFQTLVADQIDFRRKSRAEAQR